MGNLYGCNCDTRWFYSQLLGEVDPHVLLTPLTDAGANTIVHLVAAAGNTEMFKVNFYGPTKLLGMYCLYHNNLVGGNILSTFGENAISSYYVH